MTQSGYWYLASPYSSPDSRVVDRRVDETQRVLGWLLKRRIWAFSPIIHCHDLALAHELPTDAKFWQEYNHQMILRSNGIIVFELDGWITSLGVQEEIEFAKLCGLPRSRLHYEGTGESRVLMYSSH